MNLSVFWTVASYCTVGETKIQHYSFQHCVEERNLVKNYDTVHQKSKIRKFCTYGVLIWRKKVATLYDLSVCTLKSIMHRNKRALHIARQKKCIENIRWGVVTNEMIELYSKNNKLPLYMIAAQFRNADGTKLSVRSIGRYLHNNGIRSFVAA